MDRRAGCGILVTSHLVVFLGRLLAVILFLGDLVDSGASSFPALRRRRRRRRRGPGACLSGVRGVLFHARCQIRVDAVLQSRRCGAESAEEGRFGLEGLRWGWLGKRKGEAKRR